MENVLAIVVGILVACATFLILSRDLIRILLGIAILSNAANLLIFTAGRVTRDAPPLVPGDLEVPAGAYANPLPQALILTAIVIGFGLLAFALVLSYRAYVAMRTVDVDAMREAEPPYPDQSPPTGEDGRQTPLRRRGAAGTPTREAAQ
ncbi:Na+/H+ antiporter subunit C [Ferruginivarius sediminum]|uniref:Na+/H+ antiporter subunit C n=1 Tax=Ferruginivarius sediminum TaxID=2661937 RepID=A0A369THK8_9PROT|nr:Na+/H+ antiporter subunit C [Ferruginivarius sediminum]RDD63875.1 Na+/H+ antiporter subunit C [Ferruginivarius sediminum]